MSRMVRFLNTLFLLNLGIELSVNYSASANKLNHEYEPVPTRTHGYRLFEEIAPNTRIRRQINSFSGKDIKSQNLYTSCSTKLPSCRSDYKYRSLDGSCNNLKNPTWGMVNTTYSRLLPANYKVINGNLPSARALTTAFFSDFNVPDKNSSLAVMQWGQFIAHDVASTISSTSEPINCCEAEFPTNKSVCLPIEIPRNDFFYHQFNVTCQSVIRSALFTEHCNTLGEQANGVTHILDGSMIYGSNSVIGKSLREFKGGRLLVQTCGRGNTFLPNVGTSSNCSITGNSTRYRAGDSRVNQNPQLTILHTLFVREHNRIVRQLQELQPNWKDQKLFQEGRAIVIAQFQHITYNEWLPMILGTEMMNIYSLYSSSIRNFTYNSELTPVTINSFTTSAFRIGHSAIQGKICMFNKDYKPTERFNFSDLLDKPGIIQQHTNFDDFLRGLIKQPMQNIDIYYTQQITQQLFHGNNLFGTDLISTDIQRGRDHGLPSYVEFLNICSGYKPKVFSDLKRFIVAKYVPRLEEYYATVDDIDLFVGGNLEIRKPGIRIGPTFQCIIGEQFYRYKYGDRFWYEIRGQKHSFTGGQLHEIKKATLSRLICDNNNDIKSIARNSFLVPSIRNVQIPCNRLLSLNLSRWL